MAAFDHEARPLLLLAIDAATDACSVCLWRDGERIVRHGVTPRRHAQLLLPWIEAVLLEGGVALEACDAVAVSRGPGSFTGVRIGFAAAQGLAFGAGLGLVPVSTLLALAEVARRADPARRHVIAALDARMDELYAAAFRFGPAGWEAVGEEQVAAPAALQLPAGAWFLAGPGVQACDGALVERIRSTGEDASILPDALAVAALAASALAAGFVPLAPHEARPVYLRNRVTRVEGTG